MKNKKFNWTKLIFYIVGIFLWLFLWIKVEGGGIVLWDLKYTFYSILIAVLPESIGEIIFVYGSLGILLYFLHIFFKKENGRKKS
jgi:hypothetical protein